MYIVFKDAMDDGSAYPDVVVSTAWTLSDVEADRQTRYPVRVPRQAGEHTHNIGMC